jgi:hypothetical protein
VGWIFDFNTIRNGRGFEISKVEWKIFEISIVFRNLQARNVRKICGRNSEDDSWEDSGESEEPSKDGEYGGYPGIVIINYN